ncbi:MAG: heparinase II/III family protein [Bacteroidales bacterium]|jgi:hypothetical protein|nr:heparinase II/III family protein [Bacteroidales bacterium]
MRASFFLCLFFVVQAAFAQGAFAQKKFAQKEFVQREFVQGEHPNLVLTKDGVAAMRNGLGKYPLLDVTFGEAKSDVDASILEGIEVPVPKDAGGGYTHEKHKHNYSVANRAGVLWQLSGEEKYAVFARDMLLKYAALYPSLGLHPEGGNSSSPGKIFWQSLNDAVWLVNMIQAYDAVYDFCNPKERKIIEDNLFRKAVEFNTVECKKVFDMLHNHGAWNVAGVMMTGFVLGDSTMVSYALNGSNLDKKSGFFALIDNLYSPDGYYIEGPYYLRYAYWPFGLTATAIANNLPSLDIFGYRNSVLLKAPFAMLQMTDPTGHFLPFNDAIKEKAWTSQEVISAVDISYLHTGNSDLLYVADKQGTVMLSAEGVEVAKALAEGKASKSFSRYSLMLRDGANGDKGGVGILRSGQNDDQMSIVMKYGVYGMEHGHYDKLSFMMYDQNREIIKDYGAVRYLNIVQKRGGRYLPENKTFGKQTVAHNTVVIDQKSQYGANAKEADDKHSIALYFYADDSNFQVMSAIDTTAYNGVFLWRTMAMFKYDAAEKPVIIDVFKVMSNRQHTCDLPYYYAGTLIETNVKYDAHKEWLPLGNKYGYQHLFNVAEGSADTNNIYFTWYLDKRFYTLRAAATPATEVFFVQVGATDAEMSLRPEKGFIIRNKNAANYTVASVLEPHGEYNEPFEYVNGAYSNFENISIAEDSENAVKVSISTKDGREWLLNIDKDKAIIKKIK